MGGEVFHELIRVVVYVEREDQIWSYFQVVGVGWYATTDHHADSDDVHDV